MESTSGKQDHLSFPMIIAIKGPSSSEKGGIARKLAEFFQCPLIDESEISLALQNSIPITSSVNNDLPFKVACQISSTQLSLKLKVIFNTILTKHTHFNDLVQLAGSLGACTVVIECESRKDDAFDDNDVGNVPKLNIDRSKPFVAEEFAAVILQAAKPHQGKTSKRPQDNNMTLTERFIEQRHAHEFTFIKEPKNGYEKHSCNSCEKLIYGPIYKCVECDEFILHKSCAASPNPFSEDAGVWENCPSYLVKNPPEYSFPKKQKCNLCEGFSDFCNDCLLQTHIQCRFLPTIIEYKRHKHPLNFVIMPFWVNYKYLCFLCNKFGESISYKCYCCKLDFHINCVLDDIMLLQARPSITEMDDELVDYFITTKHKRFELMKWKTFKA